MLQCIALRRCKMADVLRYSTAQTIAMIFAHLNICQWVKSLATHSEVLYIQGRHFTSEIIDDCIPVIKALATGFTVGHLTSGAMGTSITVFACHPRTTDTRPIPVTLECFRSLRVTLASWKSNQNRCFN